jgi:hypothetical protein
LLDRYKLKASLVDSIPQNIRFPHAHGPRQQDVTFVEQWLEKMKDEKLKMKD